MSFIMRAGVAWHYNDGSPMSSLSARLHTQPTLPTTDVSRSGEPVSCGLPWPRGVLPDVSRLRLVDDQGATRALQARALDHWPDGSVRWVLLDWLAESGRELAVECGQATSNGSAAPPTPLSVRSAGEGRFEVDTGGARFRSSAGGLYPFDSVEVAGHEALDASHSGVVARDDANCPYRLVVDEIEIEDSGPIRATLRLDGHLRAAGGTRLLATRTRLHFFRDSAVVRLELAITNHKAAGHPGGIWHLGGNGSIYLRDLSLSLAAPTAESGATVSLSVEPGSPSLPIESPLEIFQASSGGENWDSSTHTDRTGQVLLAFRGYRARTGSSESSGLRAAPIVEIASQTSRLAACTPHFWQNFPKALEASERGLILRLFPRQHGRPHEIQGGESKTHTVFLAFGPDEIGSQTLDWCRNPLLAHAEPGWYASSGAVPELVPWEEDPNQDYLRFLKLAIEGETSFERKRETVDEYSWRHFGDVWADHESASIGRADGGDSPLISHYNNQYDMVGGFGVQFLRSGDGRWHRYMSELARHVTDIDIYHTARDKSAYNGGMFWHTVHYTDAGRSTHRSYPRAEGVPGGGPSTGHLYSSGLLLHYFLSGDPASRDAAMQLGDYVIDADDGRKTVLRFLDRGFTGHVSNSGFDDYHGPGRSGANAINALVTAHRLTREARYLEKAEQLLRRCIHPRDDIEALDLLDADRRWFYTMFLQSLGDYLDHKIELGELDEHYAYGRAALLHYASWAADNEYPYLDKPETLEFATETWAAQDMRKSEMFRIAARHAEEHERERFLERARFFFDASVGRLWQEETRAYTRPLALLLSNGWRQAWVDTNGITPAPRAEARAPDFGSPKVFISQKRRAKRRLTRVAVGAWALAALALGVTALMLWLGR
jgi:hypothetical protein